MRGMSRRWGPWSASLLLFATCSGDPPPRPPATSRVTAAPAEERKTEPSPAVRELLEDDPDLQVTITREEAQATLEAARSGAPPPPSSPLQSEPDATGRSGQWQRLEEEQKQKLVAHRERMETTIVQAGPDGAYHSSACEVLYQWIMQPDKTLQRVYLGRAVTLAHASDSGMRPHSACGAPSAEYSYSDRPRR